MLKKCNHCGEAIKLTPTATERAARYGGTAKSYTELFTTHSVCQALANMGKFSKEELRERLMTHEYYRVEFTQKGWRTLCKLR